MAFSDTEFAALLDDRTKLIEDDLVWVEDEDHSPTVEFKAEVRSEAGWQLFVKGSFNPLLPALTYALILKSVGRIYALDLGKEHRNPDRTQVGRKHKHRWTESFKDREAYVPDDITEPAERPLAVWEQFCREAGIQHDGTLKPVPPFTPELFL